MKNRGPIMRTATSDTVERGVGLRTPSRRARPGPSSLRAPQPNASTPVIPAPPLSVPHPEEALLVVPLCAPQPFSNAPEADLDGTERGFIRTSSITSSGNCYNNNNYSNRMNNLSRKRGSTHSNSNRRFNQRDIHLDRQRGSSSSTITSQDSEISCDGSTEQHSTSNSNTMEPENDAGAQPLHRNVVRRPSFTVSRAEASKMPYATVAHVGSGSTAQTTEISFHSVASNHGPLHNTDNSISNQEIRRKNSYKKTYPPLSRTFKTSFAGDIISSSRTRRSASMDPDEENNNNAQKGTKMDTKRSLTTTEGRMSSTSFSIEMLPGSREISKEFSLVANVVDEAQLETEFIERMKKRMVEAVEIRSSHTEDEENPQTSSNSRSNSSNNGESSSHRESTPDGDGNDGSGSASGTEEAPKKNMTSREKARLRKRKRLKRCVCAWVGFFMACAVLAAVLVLFLKFSKLSQNLITDDE
jgi:hypothetical protein